ncbi:MAG TPA: hypothetical protein VGA08_04035 [Candidatus Saccharimonadales bacterium]
MKLSQAAQDALKRIEAWKGPHGMPSEYIDWVVSAELIAAGAVKQDSPGPGWRLYLFPTGHKGDK